MAGTIISIVFFCIFSYRGATTSSITTLRRKECDGLWIFLLEVVDRSLPSHVSAAGDDLVVIEESATTEISGVAGKFSADSNVALASL
jgi:hypothetical protein